MFKYKQLIIGVLIGIVFTSFVGISAFGEEIQYMFTQSQYKLLVDGNVYQNPDIPINMYMYESRNYMPIAVFRDLCLKTSIPFEVDNTTKEIRITTAREEETALMNETETTPTETTTPNYNTDEENGVLVVAYDNEKYVEIHSLKESLRDTNYTIYLDGVFCVLQKLNSTTNKYDNISQNVEYYEKLASKLKDKNFTFGKIFISYEDYVSKIRPLIKE